MVVRLAEQLEVPLRDRNELLLAAGYAPLYGERPLDDPEMTPVREALELVLRGHEPYPAAVVDRWWEMVAANSAHRAAHRGRGCRAARAARRTSCAWRCTPRGWRRAIVNFGEWRAHLLERLRHQASVTGDAALAALYEEVSAYPGPPDADAHHGAGGEVFVPLVFRAADDRELRFFSTVATFGTARGHHRGRAGDRVVLPGGFGDGRGAARRLTASEGAAPRPRRAGDRRRRPPSPARRPSARAAPPAPRRS